MFEHPASAPSSPPQQNAKLPCRFELVWQVWLTDLQGNHTTGRACQHEQPPAENISRQGTVSSCIKNDHESEPGIPARLASGVDPSKEDRCDDSRIFACCTSGVAFTAYKLAVERRQGAEQTHRDTVSSSLGARKRMKKLISHLVLKANGIPGRLLSWQHRAQRTKQQPPLYQIRASWAHLPPEECNPSSA